MTNLEALDKRMEEAIEVAFKELEEKANLVRHIENKWGLKKKNKRKYSIPFSFLVKEKPSTEYVDPDQYMIQWTDQHGDCDAKKTYFRVCVVETAGNEVSYIGPYLGLPLAKRKEYAPYIDPFIDEFLLFVQTYEGEDL